MLYRIDHISWLSADDTGDTGPWANCGTAWACDNPSLDRDFFFRVVCRVYIEGFSKDAIIVKTADDHYGYMIAEDHGAWDLHLFKWCPLRAVVDFASGMVRMHHTHHVGDYYRDGVGRYHSNGYIAFRNWFGENHKATIGRWTNE